MDYRLLAVLCPLIFFAGFVDAVAGGGGLISLPSYVACGLPFHISLGTNKFSASFAGLVSSYRYIKNKKADIKIALCSAAFALVGSSLGAKVVQETDPTFLKYLLIIATPVIAFFVLKKKDFGVINRVNRFSPYMIVFIAIITGFVLGFYDGFYGPGMGAFLIIVFTTLLGYDAVTASGNAKIINLSSNLAALITFAIGNKILYSAAIPCAVCSIAGGYLGSGLAIKNGARFIRPVFVCVLSLLVLYIINDVTGFFVLGSSD